MELKKSCTVLYHFHIRVSKSTRKKYKASCCLVTQTFKSCLSHLTRPLVFMAWCWKSSCFASWYTGIYRLNHSWLLNATNQFGSVSMWWCILYHTRKRPQDLQVGQACLAHSGGNGFDGSQHGVDELGQLTGRPLSLAARLHDEPGQGPHVRVKCRMVRHVWFWSFCPSCWAADWTADEEQMRDLTTSQVLFVPEHEGKPGGSISEHSRVEDRLHSWEWVRGCPVSAAETGQVLFFSQRLSTRLSAVTYLWGKVCISTNEHENIQVRHCERNYCLYIQVHVVNNGQWKSSFTLRDILMYWYLYTPEIVNLFSTI